MKASIWMEFDLPEEEDAYRLWVQAPAYAQALHRLREEFRAKYKYSETEPKDWHEVYSMFWDIVKDEGVELP